jgi:hypothetical protein
VSRRVRLPRPDGSLELRELGDPTDHPRPSTPLRSRRVLAAAHVVADPLADNSGAAGAAVDWDATLAYRRHLWSYGLGVADAMDTAQRGMGLDWCTTRELIRRSCAEAAAEGGTVACGALTDQLPVGGRVSLETIIGAYEEQLAEIERAGGQAVLMASRHLAAVATGPDDYHRIYGHLLEQVDRPVIVHWLGAVFDPALEGYWGGVDLDAATETFLEIVTDHAERIDGVKISLLDKAREIDLRRRLPEGVRLYTGDDYDYPETIGGDEQGHSDALLGAFDMIAPAASAAVRALDEGDRDRFEAVLAPTVPLSRHVFGPPTYYYKTGVVFQAYLAGHQDHFRMIRGLESARSALHLAEQVRLADAAGLLPDPELAATRAARVMALSGIEPPGGTSLGS